MNDQSNLISFCGLYCGACSSFKKGSCPGCGRNEKSSWCKVRKCCLSYGVRSCADCKVYLSVIDCPKFNNFAAKVFGFVFNTDRLKGINFIKSEGYDLYAQKMISIDRVCLKRKD